MIVIEKSVSSSNVCTKVMLAAEEWCTGAAVFTDVLDPEVLEHVERDVETFIRAFDEGYEPPSSPGSLTSGEGTPSNQISVERFRRDGAQWQPSLPSER